MEEDILYAYEQAWVAWNESGKIPDPNYPGIREWIVEDSPAFNAVVDNRTELLANDLHVEGDFISSPEIFSIDGQTAIVHDCQLDRAARYTADGVALDELRPYPIFWEGELRLTESGWKAYEMRTSLERCEQ